MAVIMGISDEHTVMVDLDDTTFFEALKLAALALKKFRLGGFIIFKSSPEHYHLIFDKPCSVIKVFKVISWIAIMSRNPNIWKYVCMQGIKGYCTLRVSPKPINPNGFKHTPRIVYRHGTQNQMIKDYLTFRKHILKSVKNSDLYT